MKTSDIDSVNIGWAAGLLEGEACFDIRKSGALVKDPHNMHCRIVVEMKDKDVLERLQRLFGGTLTEVKCPSKIKDEWSTYYKWLLTKREEIYVCLTSISDHMSERRKDRINEILKFLDRKLFENKQN